MKVTQHIQGLSPRRLSVFAGIFGVVGLLLITLTLAASNYASFEPENGTLANGATQVSSAGASGGKAIQLSAPPVQTPPPPPTPSGWPDASTTGYQYAPGYPGHLSSCSTNIQSNTTYQFCDFSGGLYIGSSSNHPVNVSFIGCRFASNATVDANVAIYGDNISFDYVTFEPSAKSAPPVTFNQGYQYGIDQRYAGKVTINHANFWGWGNGIQIGSSNQAKPFSVSNSYFHDARDDGGQDHTDAILENYGGLSYMVFDHNTIVSIGNTNGLALQAGNHTNYDHLTVTNNYFSGFAYTVNIGGGGYLANSSFTDNTFGTDIKPTWGPLYGWGGTNNLWRRNKWKIAPGTTWSPPSNDGKYWWPDGTLSTSDYTG